HLTPFFSHPSVALLHLHSFPTRRSSDLVIRPVAVKTVEQQDEQAFHRIRQQLKSEQTALINQLRGLLNEYGIVIPKGIAKAQQADRKSTRLNSSHVKISYAVFCLKKKNK